jgi:hypothetical protein
VANVATIPITTAVTAAVTGAASVGTISAVSATIQTNFIYGSGGTTFSVWVQTSIDGGTTWIDVCNMSGTTASKLRVQVVSTRTPITTPYTVTDGTLTADTCHDGIVGPIWRTKLTTTGTYAGNTSLAVDIFPGP